MQAKELRRDKAIGIFLIIICLVVLPVYLLLIFYPAQVLYFFGASVDGSSGTQVRVYASLIPVVIGVVFLLLAGAWVGISIVTTKAPNENQDTSASEQTQKQP